MTPAETLLARWAAMSEPVPGKWPARYIAGLGNVVLAKTKSSCHVAICSIWAETPGQGKGTELMKRLTDLADELGVFLEVVPLRDKPWLTAWYEKHGFTEMALDDIAKLRVPRIRTPGCDDTE